MATKKITELVELLGSDVDAKSDVLAIVDAGSNATKKITVDGLHSGSFSGSFTGDGSGLTGVISASYAVSASVEIIKEISSSHANVADFASSGNGIFSGSFSGSYEGDGTNLNLASNTTIPSAGAFPFNGDAVISGSLLISASEQTASLILKSSGSTILDVRGSLGSMFSVTDSFDGNLFEVNNISGISLLSVSSSGDVDIPKGNLTVSGSVSASKFLGDGSALTGVGGDAFPFTGTARITGSLDVSGSLSVTDTVSLLNFDKNSGTIGPVANDGWELGIGTTADSGAKVRLQQGTYHNTGLLIHGRSTTDSYTPLLVRDGSSNSLLSVLSDGLVTAHKNFKVGGNTEMLGSVSISGSGGLSVESSGSTVFIVVGSTGTLFEVDDSLEGIIFTANDSTGAPSFQVSSSGEVFLGKSPQSLYTTKQIASTISTATESIFSMTTSSLLTTLAFDYSCVSESNARAGTINSVFIPGTDLITFSETATSDIGDTSGVHLSVEITQSQAQFLSKTNSAGWRIKSIIRSI